LFERQAFVVWRSLSINKLCIFKLGSFYVILEIPKDIFFTSWTSIDPIFWQGDDHKKKSTLAKWSIMCRPKEQGGLSILDLEIQNKCLLR
jgi:hypothetical protein